MRYNFKSLIKSVIGRENVNAELKIEKSFQDELKEEYKDFWSYNDIDEKEREIISEVKKYTMTSPERIITLIRAVKYIILNNIEGDFVECGVWKGGSMMAISLTLISLGVVNRKLYLYDTFEGMTEPTKIDVDYFGEHAIKLYNDNYSQESNSSQWCYSSFDEVKANLLSTQYPESKMYFVKGKVEETIPENIPNKIALLRLDTDWFDSTYHELIHLFPLLSSSGFIIVDDYGHWRGSQMAVDKYFTENKLNIFLNRVDYSCRLGQKPA